MNLQENERLTAMVETVLAVAEPLQRGQVLTHKAMEKATGVRRYSEHWGPLVTKVKRAMRERRHIVIWPTAHLDGEPVGYRLLTHEEQVRLPARKRTERATRQVNRAVREVASTPQEGLTDFQRAQQAANVHNLIAMRRALKRERRRQQQSAPVAFSMPRPARV